MLLKTVIDMRVKGVVMKRIVILSAALLLFHSLVWGQVSGVRGINGGVGALFSLTGPTSSLYIDVQGTHGFLSNPAGTGGAFESYIFRNPNTGQAWMGGMTTLGPQLNPGLIAGGVQSSFSGTSGTFVLSSSPTVIPPPP
ncbi:MAG TPA: hypothetical protein VJ746_12825, partial [Nitrospira sp.]|nr:hypothetical protein [Nitrospira sp.]